MLTFQILVVDDDPMVRSLYGKFLSRAKPVISVRIKNPLDPNGTNAMAEDNRIGFDVTLADCGEAAVTAVEASLERQQPFAAAFVDIMMPGIDGVETVRRIWDIDPDIKIVFVTGAMDYTSDQIVSAIGRDDVFYLRKPFSSSEIKQFARAFVVQWALEREREWLIHQWEKANRELEDMNKNLQQKVAAQSAQLVQSEKMASIGILAAGLAHEINNPIAFINANLTSLQKYSRRLTDLVQRYRRVHEIVMTGAVPALDSHLAEIERFKKERKIDFITDDMEDLLSESLDGLSRVRNIIDDMKTFSRADQAERQGIDINESLDVTLNILRNEYKYKAEITKDYGELPTVTCFPQKISQVFMNLLMNAIQAIEADGRIQITTRAVTSARHADNNMVRIRISDTGSGIPPHKLSKIFDPFFTTKPPGDGIGLGLSISYDIIQAHNGSIDVESTPDHGTTFTVCLPQGVEVCE